MFNITEYKIVHYPKAEMVAEEVNKLIKIGWQPFGSLTTTSGDQNAVFYSQALVKTGELTG